MSSQVSISSSAIDRENPWPGLASFTEDARAFFFGREKETEELVRLVRRNTLTVLFGQSGLGKSSLLQAGAFPLLREADYLPLYLRLDHDPAAPALADQIKSSLVEAFKSVGADAPAPRPDESLWEYFHRKDIDIWSAKNRLLTPILAFDQFEEIFTLGRATDAQRERGRAFLAELADLVENRPPAALRAKFDAGELDPARYAFDKPSCQVILSLREDFLPDLEGLKNEMRSIMQSRMRVRRLNGTQALEIVTRPAPHLLAEGVAERIVEFVAGARGGSAERLTELEVEPALLSVICRELNERRRTLGQPQISADLVSGNRREILTDFYERSVADLPEAMRAFVEDHLLTKSGFRDNLALETALEFPGVTRPLIDTLVARRLVRLEDRLGVQRVELTHDVLAEVIRASRDTRQERIAVEQLQQRERVTRRRMWLARTIAAGLFIGLGGVSWIAWRAIRAERAQEELRQRAEVLRQTAETRQRLEAQRWSRSDVAAASRFLDEGKPQQGLAFLVHAAQIDADNPVIAGRLISALANRSFVRPYGDTVRLPAAMVNFDRSTADFTPDGRSVGVWGKDGVYRLVNFASGRVDHEIRLGAKVTAAFMWGNSVLTWAPEVPAMSYYDPSSGAQRSSRSTAQDGDRQDVSADGRWSAFSSEDGISFFDVMAGEQRGKLARRNDIWAWFLSPNGTRLATMSVNRDRVQIWSVPEGNLLTEVIATKDVPRFSAVALSYDSRLLAVRHGRGVQLFEAATGQPVGSLLPHEGEEVFGSRPAFTPDDSRLISTGRDRVVKVWDLRTGQLALPPLLHNGSVEQLRVADHGRILFTRTGNGLVRWWDLTTGQQVVEPLNPTNAGRISMAPDGRHVAEVTAAGEVRRLVAEPNSARPLDLPRLAGEIRNDDGAIAVSEWAADRPATVIRVTKNRLIYLDAAAGREVAGGFDFPSPIQRYRMSADSRVMLVTTEAGMPQAWTFGPEGPRVVPLEDFPAGAGVAIRMSDDGSLAVAMARVGIKELRVWNLRTGQPAGPAMPYEAALWRANGSGSFSPDAKWVAAGSNNGEAKVWEIATGKLVRELKPLAGGVRRVEFSPDGARIATVEMQDGARLWDAATGQALSPPLKLSGGTKAAAPGGFSKDGRWLLTYAPAGGSVAVWDVRLGARVGAQIEHGADIRPPMFSPDGSQVLTAGEDGAARVWDTQTGQLLAEPLRHGAPISGAHFSPNGRFILTQSASSLARIWPTPPRAGARAPEWLLRLATMQAGTVVNDDGDTVDAPAEGPSWSALRAEVNALPADAPLAAWGKWLLADADKRMLAPGFEITEAEAQARGLIAAPIVAVAAEENELAAGARR